jgi:hypothetical protein
VQDTQAPPVDSGAPEADSDVPVADSGVPVADSGVPVADSGEASGDVVPSEDSQPASETSTPDTEEPTCPPLEDWYVNTDVVEPALALEDICQQYLDHAEALGATPDAAVNLIDLQTGTLTEATPAEVNNPGLSKRRLIANAVERQALCNDGSPAVYYYRPGTVNKWVIHLEGGGACSSPKDCLDNRWNDPTEFHKMSSCDQEAARDHQGILSPDESVNPDFYNWHHVFVEYCSSDTWAGDVPPGLWNNPRTGTAEERLWYFRGRRIVGAAIEDLLDPERTPEPNLSQATELIFTGTSAGAGGLRTNLDWVAGMVPGIQVCGIVDAAFKNPGDLSVVPEIKPTDVFVQTYLGPHPHPACYAETCNPYACSEANYVGLAHTSTPFFVQMNQWDTKVNPGQDADIASDIREVVATRNGAYSHREEGKHVYITLPRWNDPAVSSFQVGPVKYTYREVFGAWYFDRTVLPDADAPGGEKPAFKLFIRDEPNTVLHSKAFGGMCGGAYPQ